jgi:ligand-binding SRPBCC domain-containing protein
MGIVRARGESFMISCTSPFLRRVVSDMPLHVLRRQETLPIAPAAAWEFFSNPRNLVLITPPSLGFEVLTPNLPERIYAGMMIAYRVRPLAGIPVLWLTEITHVREGEYFVDEQRAGPYALWHHEHWLRPAARGGTEVEDLVTYRLPLGWLGGAVHRLLVRRRIESIFDYRSTAVHKLAAANKFTHSRNPNDYPGRNSFSNSTRHAH